jgi:hypothetical protein
MLKTTHTKELLGIHKYLGLEIDPASNWSYGPRISRYQDLLLQRDLHAKYNRYFAEAQATLLSKIIELDKMIENQEKNNTSYFFDTICLDYDPFDAVCD